MHDKYCIKTSLSISSIGCFKHSSQLHIKYTPIITDWITDLILKDDYLAQLDFEIQQELATASFSNTYFESFGPKSTYNKMISIIWKESPYKYVSNDQTIVPMAGLMYKDSSNKSFLYELIKSSNLDTKGWLNAYFKAFFKPLIHCFYCYGIAFMPSGENILLVLEGNIPIKIIIRNVADEIILFEDRFITSDVVSRLYDETSSDLQLMSIFSNIFDSFFRFLSEILVSQCDITEYMFWKLVADCVKDYQKQFPELQEKFEKLDMFKSEYKRCCHNRFQLSNSEELMVFRGMLKNPIGKFRPIRRQNESNELNDFRPIKYEC